MFYALAAFVLVLAGCMLAARQMVRAVLALLACVVGLAFIYFLLGAHAAGAAQLMLYGGGVMVLLIFGIMTAPDIHPKLGPVAPFADAVSGFAAATALLVGLVRVFMPAMQQMGSVPPLAAYTGGTLQGAGTGLITQEAAAFEWAALLLLLALAFAAPLVARIAKGTAPSA
jgi:NADH:ubiquinone oxidoreductase subunit 6 (subunit J)